MALAGLVGDKMTLLKTRLRALIVIATLYPLLTGFFWATPYDTYNEASDLYKAGKYAEAFNRYIVAIEKSGDDIKDSIYFRLAEMHLKGKGTAKNESEALRYFEKVANGSDKGWRLLALSQLGQMHRDGIGTSKNTTRAIDAYEQLANEGDAEQSASAYWSLADIFSKASDKPIQDERAKAASLLQRCLAKVSSDKTCQSSLELLSEHPDVLVYLNSAEYKQTDSGLAPAGMAQGYQLFGKGEFEKAFEIFRWHARNGNAEAQLEVALQYSRGAGVKADKKIASGWMYLAGKNGNPRAQRELGLAIATGQIWGSIPDAIFWLEAASRQGDADAYNELGRVWLNPLDDIGRIQSNPQKAFEYFKKGAELGSLFAVTNLGYMYLNGIGVAQDKEVAKQLFIRAAQSGETNARLALFQHFNYALNTLGKQVYREKSEQPKANATPKAPDQQGIKIVEKIVERVIERKEEKPSPVEVFAKTSPAVLKVLAVSGAADSASQGSAVSIADGIAVTNCHVIRGMAAVGTRIQDQVILFSLGKASAKKDICILKVDRALPTIRETRQFADLKVGEKVFALGSPKGLNNTFSEGIVSGLRVSDGIKWVQTTAPITHGSSGGALIDEFGRLIGITTQGVKEGNLNFAVSVDDVFDTLRQ